MNSKELLENVEPPEKSHMKGDHATEIVYDIEECSIAPELNIQPPPTPEPVTVKVESDSDKILLEPDHPLLASFQRILKEQLERQILRLQDEVSEIDSDIKQKSNDRNTIGEQVYDCQILLSNQVKSLDKLENDVKQLIDGRREFDLIIEDVGQKYAELSEKKDNAEKKNHEMRNELDEINFLIKQMSDWEDTLQSHMAITQRITDKSKVEKKQFMDEMRDLDLIVYKLMTEVYRLENSKEHKAMQLRVMEKEREAVSTRVYDANADIEALEQEQKCIVQSWNSVLVAIDHRDKIYSAAQNDLKNVQQNLDEVLQEIYSFKRLNQKEMEKNEELTLHQERMEIVIKELQTKSQIERDKINVLETKIMENEAIKDQVNGDLSDAENEVRALQLDLDDVILRITKNTALKAEINERILTKLQTQMSNDKVSKYLNRTIRDLREKNRNREIQLAMLENKNADILVKVEQQKVINEDCAQQIKDYEALIKTNDEEMNCIKADITATVAMYHKNMSKYDLAAREYDEFIKKQGGLELTPVEMKIRTLEKTLADLQDKNRKLQSLWLRQQLYIVQLTKERNDQVSDMNISQKQYMLLRQRNLRLNDTLANFEHQEKLHFRLIKKMKAKIDRINEDIWKKRGRAQHLDLNSITFKTDCLQKLENSELDCIQLNDKVTEMEEEKETLCQELVEANRDLLNWEQKVQIAQETKSTVMKEKLTGGEIGEMKAEIHRMDVRYSQLRKAQEKLVQDLNQCVSRREFIFINSAATEKQYSGNSKRPARNSLSKKILKLQSDIEQIKTKQKDTSYRINKLKQMGIELDENLKDIVGRIEILKPEKENKIIRLQTMKCDKEKEFATINFKESKLHAFTQMMKKRYVKRYRTKNLRNVKARQEVEKNNVLKDIIKKLVSEFPDFILDFSIIIHNLQVVENT